MCCIALCTLCPAPPSPCLSASCPRAFCLRASDYTLAMTKSSVASTPRAERVDRATKCFKSAGTRLATLTTQLDTVCRENGIASLEFSQAKKAYDDATRRYESENSRYREALRRRNIADCEYSRLHRRKIDGIPFATARTNAIECRREFIRASDACLVAARNRAASLHTFQDARIRANISADRVDNSRRLLERAENNLRAWSWELRRAQQPERAAPVPPPVPVPVHVSPELEALRRAALDRESASRTRTSSDYVSNDNSNDNWDSDHWTRTKQ